MDYSTVKFIHILGVTLFLGNFAVSALWKLAADRTDNPEIVAFACRITARSDLIFTLVGAILIMLGGLGLLYTTGLDITDSPHVTIGISLFAVAGMVWLVALVPLNIYMSMLAQKAVSAGETGLPAEYRKCLKVWLWVVSLAILAPAGAIWFMVNP